MSLFSRFCAAGLVAAACLCVWQRTRLATMETELAGAHAALAASVAANEANLAAIHRLERSMENTDKILAGWNEDRTTLAGVRSSTRQAIKEAMRDASFKAWVSGSVPADAWRLLREAPVADNAGGNSPSDAPGGAVGGLPGNPGSGKRQ